MSYQDKNLEAKDWNCIIASLPNPQVLQTWEWGSIKSKYGWDPNHLVWRHHDRIVAGALILKRNLNIPLFKKYTNILYIPKGPLLDWGDPILYNEVLMDLHDYAKQNRALFIKVDPEVILGQGLSDNPDDQLVNSHTTIISNLKQRGWRLSNEQIQFKNTVLIDLSLPEEELLGKMKQKTRYNIRLAARKGVTIRTGTFDDLELLYKMYAETSIRDSFVIRNESYYKTLWGSFLQKNQKHSQDAHNVDPGHPIAEPLIAEVNGEPVAAVIIFRFARKAWYMYGMSRALHREKMPNYLLQWEAMRRAKAVGCHTYDMWGAPDNYNERDPLWGVYQFKEGFGGIVIRHLGALDLPIKPVNYTIYNSLLPRILGIMRIMGRKSTEQSLMN